MSTPLTDRISLLTSQANAATGGSDTTLSDAIETLIAGYGGGSGNIKIESGVLTISKSTIEIVVNHNLGGIPEFAYICADIPHRNLVPMNSCICAVYGYILPLNTQDANADIIMRYIYTYRHATSGNILSAYANLAASKYAETTFAFVRGQSPWASTDTNGDPIPYKWMVGRFTE